MILGIPLVVFLPTAILLFILFLFVRTPHGAPFVPTPISIVERMIALARPRPLEKAADIGSGDGRMVLALAQSGVDAHGYEINPLLVWWSRYQIRQNGKKKHAHIHQADFWKEDFSAYTLVTLYGVPSMMADLEKKLLQELPAGARIVSHRFPFPTWKPKKVTGHLFLYIR